MSMLFDSQLVSFIAFIIVVAVLVFKDRRKIKVQSGIVLMRRTQKGKQFIDRLANRNRSFWNSIGVLGAVVAIPMMIIGLAFLSSNAIGILEHKVTEGVRFVLPYPVADAQMPPGLLLLPWWIWVIGIALVVIPHEFFHGIMCRLDGVRIKSLGWILLLFIPGAFVEPDEEQLKKKQRSTKLKVYAAGSFANVLVAALVLILGIVLVNAFYTNQGIIPSALVEGSPASAANLSGAILLIDEMPITSREDLRAILDKTPIGTTLQVRTTAGMYNITTEKHPDFDVSYLGVSAPYAAYKDVAPSYGAAKPFLDGTRQLLFWTFVLSLGIGIVNILPIRPLDGGVFFEEILSKYTRRSRQLTTVVSIVVLGLLLFNLFGPIFVK